MTRPDSWTTVRLGVIAETMSGGTPSRSNSSYYGGAIPWIKSGELGDTRHVTGRESITQQGLEKSAAKVVPAGTLCIALYGATVGKLGILSTPSATNQAVCAISPGAAVVRDYLWHFLISARSQLLAHAKGGAQRNISQAILREVEVPLAPLPEQGRIVGALEALDAQLNSAETILLRNRQRIVAYRAAVLRAACEGRLVPTEAELPRATNLSAVTTRITKGSSPNWQGFEYGPEGIPFVRSQNVGRGRVALDGLARLPPEFNDKERKSILKEGDVLMNIVGASIGRAAVASTEVAGGNVNQAVAVISPDLAHLDPKYLTYWLLSPLGQRWIHSEKVDVARANLSLSDLRDLELALPCLDEQRKTVAEIERRLSAVEQLEAAIDRGLARAKRLRQAILKRAFEGRLVPQDPNDEPASVLLERIRKEREAAAVPKRRRGRSA